MKPSRNAASRTNGSSRMIFAGSWASWKKCERAARARCLERAHLVPLPPSISPSAHTATQPCLFQNSIDRSRVHGCGNKTDSLESGPMRCRDIPFVRRDRNCLLLLNPSLVEPGQYSLKASALTLSIWSIAQWRLSGPATLMHSVFVRPRGAQASSALSLALIRSISGYALGSCTLGYTPGRLLCANRRTRALSVSLLPRRIIDLAPLSSFPAAPQRLRHGTRPIS